MRVIDPKAMYSMGAGFWLLAFAMFLSESQASATRPVEPTQEASRPPVLLPQTPRPLYSQTRVASLPSYKRVPPPRPAYRPQEAPPPKTLPSIPVAEEVPQFQLDPEPTPEPDLEARPEPTLDKEAPSNTFESFRTEVRVFEPFQSEWFDFMFRSFRPVQARS